MDVPKGYILNPNLHAPEGIVILNDQKTMPIINSLVSKIIYNIEIYNFDEAISLMSSETLLNVNINELPQISDAILKIKSDRMFAFFIKKINYIYEQQLYFNYASFIDFQKIIHDVIEKMSINGTIFMMKYACDHIVIHYRRYDLQQFYINANPAIAGYLRQFWIAPEIDLQNINEADIRLSVKNERDREIIWSLLEREVLRNDRIFASIDGELAVIFKIFDETNTDLKTYLCVDVAGIVHSYLCDEPKEQMNVLDMPNDFDNVD